MRKFFTLIAMLTSATIAMAQTISEATAKEKASQFFSQNTSFAKGSSAAMYPTLAYTSKVGEATCFYVYNNGNSGFVIIGGDEAAQEVIGYSENGAFDYATAPENLKWWLSQYTTEISRAISDVKAGRVQVARIAPRKTISKTDIANIVTAEWDQGSPYNNNLPKMTFATDGYQNLATGCVATAAAQVMYKWKWPENGTGSNSYTVYYTNTSGNYWAYYQDNTTSDHSMTFSSDFSAHNYDWANMTNTYNSSSTNEQKAAVAQLMADVGIASGMLYGQVSYSGSGAHQENLGQALIKNFGYSKNINNRYRANYTNAEWEDLVYTELAAGRPLIYGAVGTLDGTTATGGHQFIISGYQTSTNKYYLNWGWSGSYNGYFLLTGTNALTPDGTGSGGAAEGSAYILEQGFLQNVQPEEGDAQRCYMYTCGYGLSGGGNASTSLAVSAGTIVSMVGFGNVANSGYLLNSGCNAITTNVGIRLVNTENESDVIDYNCGTYSFSASEGNALSFTPTTAGSYKVIPIYKSAGEWVEARATTSIPYPTLTVSAQSSGLALVSWGFNNDTYATVDDTSLKATIKNYSSSSTTKTFTAFIMESSDGLNYNSIGAYTAENVILAASGETTVSFGSMSLNSGASITTGGNYALWFSVDGNALADMSSVTFCNSANISYTMTDAGWGTLCLPFCAEVPSGLTAYSVNEINTSTGVITLKEASELNMNTPYIIKGTAGDYNFSGPQTSEGTYAAGKLVGTTASDTYAPKGSYVLQKNDGVLAFYKVAELNKQPLSQYRACIYIPNTALTSLLLPNVTGIDDVLYEEHTVNNVNNGAAYNLAGQRVSPDTKGIVIINGKKIFNK